MSVEQKRVLLLLRTHPKTWVMLDILMAKYFKGKQLGEVLDYAVALLLSVKQAEESLRGLHQVETA